jgi:hypothetical protein
MRVYGSPIPLGKMAHKLASETTVTFLIQPDSLDLIHGQLILGAVIQLGRFGRFMIGDLLRLFQSATMLQIRSNARRTAGMASWRPAPAA